VSDDKNRQSLLLPVLIPLGALVVIGVVLFGFSRVLLQITATAAWVTALIAAAGIMVVASYVASRKAVGGGSLFSMVGAVAGIAMLTGGVALFAAERGGEEGPELAMVRIVAPEGASQTGFAEETRQVTAPANEPFEIVLDNQEAQSHNVVIVPPGDPDTERFREPPFVGPLERTWEVEPLEEGTYDFFCEVHPTTMTGTLVASAPTIVVAQSLAFDTDEINLSAGAPTPITFQNQDAGIPHNLSIYRNQDYTDPVYEPQDPFPGPGERTYNVPPLEPGTLYFRCDVHPTTMEGRVVVEAEGGGAEGEPPAEPTEGG
jgi:plastocyanin